MNRLAEDMALAKKVNALISASNGHTTRTTLARALGVSREKLNRLQRLGMLDGYPSPLSYSQAATLGRKVSPWGTKFRLKGSPNFSVGE